MTTPNPALDEINKVKVPSGWQASQKLVDLLKQHATQGTQIGFQDLDGLLGVLIGSQIELIHAFGTREAQAAAAKESLKGLGDLFKRPPKAE